MIYSTIRADHTYTESPPPAAFEKSGNTTVVPALPESTPLKLSNVHRCETFIVDENERPISPVAKEKSLVVNETWYEIVFCPTIKQSWFRMFRQYFHVTYVHKNNLI